MFNFDVKFCLFKGNKKGYAHVKITNKNGDVITGRLGKGEGSAFELYYSVRLKAAAGGKESRRIPLSIVEKVIFNRADCSSSKRDPFNKSKIHKNVPQGKHLIHLKNGKVVTPASCMWDIIPSGGSYTGQYGTAVIEVHDYITEEKRWSKLFGNEIREIVFESLETFD